MKKVLLIMALLATALAACARRNDLPVAASAETTTATATAKAPTAKAAPKPMRVPVYYGEDITTQGSVTRFIDGDAGVLCYRATYQPSVSCVPLSRTTLRADGLPQYPENMDPIR